MENFMSEYGVHFWLILGVILGIAEILTVSFFALPFALGAIITAGFAAFRLPLNGQIAVFAISSLIMLFVIQLLVKKYFMSKESEKVKTNSSAMIGREVLVIDPIDGSLKKGSVKVGGEVWSAVTADGQSFEKNDIVKVIEVGGAKLIVGKRDNDK